MAFDKITYAARAWQILVGIAKENRTTTYGELAQQLGVHHRVCPLFLAPIQEHCMAQSLFPLTAIVVGKQSGLPGHGFIAWDISDAKTAFEKVYQFNWLAVQNPFEFALKGETPQKLADLLLAPNPNWKKVYKTVESRTARQAIFRQALVTAYGSQCAMSLCRHEDLLEAAHILPWCESSPQEQLDIRNGLLLATTYHHLFDLGWIRIGTDYGIYGGQELPKKDWGTYLDRVLRIALKQKLHLPREFRLHPNLEYIRRRYELSPLQEPSDSSEHQ